MKHVIIVALLCLNAVLLVALVVGTNSPAIGQAVAGRGDFAVTTGKDIKTHDAVYILDTATRRVAVIRYDRAANRMVALSRVDLSRDFGRQEHNN